MKKIILAIFLLFTITNCYSQETGSFTDSRDGKTYKTVTIGNQTWFAENLNYETENSRCYDNDKNNCSKFGRLYYGKDMNNACPNGWHVPSTAEWQELFDFFGGRSKAGQKIKEGGSSGFDAKMGGFNNSEINFRTFFWASTESKLGWDAIHMDIYCSIWPLAGTSESIYYIRCVKD